VDGVRSVNEAAGATGAVMPAEAGIPPRPTTATGPEPNRILLGGLATVAVLMLATALDLGGQQVFWENAHWTLAGATAFAYAALTAYRSTGQDRRVAALVAVGTGCWLLGQVAWVVQTAAGVFAVPAPSDLGFLMLVPPVVIAFVIALAGRLPKAEEVAVYLDAVAIFLAITGVLLTLYGRNILATATLPVATIAIVYPVVHLAAAGAGLVTLLAVRASPRGGGYILLAGFALLGYAWVEWLGQAVVALPASGTLPNYAFSIGIIAVGVGASAWRIGEATSRRFETVSSAVVGGLPLIALLISALLLAGSHIISSDIGPVELCALTVIVLTGVRQSFLVHERGRLLEDSHTARDQLEVALLQRAEADSRYQTLVERVPAAVYIDVFDTSVSDGGHLAYLSPQIESILGYAPSAFVEDPELWPGLTHPEDRSRVVAALGDHWQTGQPLRVDYRMIAADGSVVWVHDEAYAIEDESTGKKRVSQGILVDTTEQKRLEAQLLHDAFHDPLTGLANRALFREHLDRTLERSRRRRTEVAVLFLDIDDFKVVNDSLGHGAGDRLLVEVAHRLSGIVRAGDVAARQGGDEFTILIERVRDEAEAVAMAERIADELRRPIVLDGRPLVVGVSIGLALARGREAVATDLLAHADVAMYAAKEAGKGRTVVFDPSMRRRAQSRLEMEAELRAAIESNAFELHYQPIVELPSRGVVGFEALVRWRHPDRGLVPPGEFIPLAEATGLIVPLGNLVMTEACRQLRAWREDADNLAHLTVSVNVSARQVNEPGFAAEVRDILTKTGLEPSALVLEITESLTLRESASGDGALRQLHNHGVSLAIDDFGTGFSSLEYFKRFAVQGLKIDQSFVAGLGRSREDTAIVTATISFASALGLIVTAEGVEEPEQLSRLEDLGCHRAQGFLFSPAVPAAAVPELLLGVSWRTFASATARDGAPATVADLVADIEPGAA
jgi:diguanylate cyclase (GGDEF)-like protein/PAS domain S-box-containing protein